MLAAGALAAPALLAQTPAAQAAAALTPEAAAVKKLLEQKFAGRGGAAASSRRPYFGLYEVQFDDQIVYTDAKVTYVLVGIDLRHRTQEEPDRGAASAS